MFVGFWRRFCAFLIDQLVLAVPTFLLFMRSFSGLSAWEVEAFRYLHDSPWSPGQLDVDPRLLTAIDQDRWRVIETGVLILAIQMLYYVVLWTSRGGTVGQRAFGIHVRREGDLAQIGVGRACLRFLGWLISAAALFIGFIWVRVDARKQGWHDKIAATVVIRRITSSASTDAGG